jgi:STAM-binding protein
MPSENHHLQQEVQEPHQRVKLLSESASNINVDDSVPIKRYWRSGKELIRMANIYSDEGHYDKAFILYMKYITLVILLYFCIFVLIFW